MAIQNLTEEQIKTWTPEQKDRWWLENVYRGNMPQLTIRSAITGFVLGGLLSATNLYIGAKTGWTLGVGLTSVILAFAMFKVFSRMGAKDMTILENNAMQSIATSAGYMTGPLVSGIAAYMMVSNTIIPWWQMLLFNVVLSVLGVLVAFPMKRRFINNEQQPFPEGRACGVLLDTLYTSAAALGLFKARALAFAALFAGGIKFCTGEYYQTFLQGTVLKFEKIRWLSEHPFEKLIAWLGVDMPTIANISIKKLDLSPTINLEMFGAGGLMNIRYGANMFAGMVLTWVCVMPFIVNMGDTTNSKGQVLTAPAYVSIVGGVKLGSESKEQVVSVAVNSGVDSDGKAFKGALTVSGAGVVDASGQKVDKDIRVENGEITFADGSKQAVISNFNRAQLLNSWGLWPGVAMLVCASMVALFAKPQVLIGAFSGLFKKGERREDCLKDIEVPLWVSFVGIPIVGAIGVWMAHEWFEVRWIWGALAIPLIAVLTLIAANATALTSITPTGSLSKITQFTFGFLDRKYPVAGQANPAVNLMTACMTTEVASNAANLLMDIKPGYMLGAKPRQQVIGHIIGIISGALASTPLFYMLFLAGHKDNPFTSPNPALAESRVEDVLLADPEKFSFTGAVQWKGISDLITGGLSQLPQSAVIAMIVAAVAGVVFEIWRTVSKSKFPVSPLALGLGIVLPPDSTLWMFLGSLFFWVMHKIYEKRTQSMGHKLWIETHEPLCAGLIAGAALIGIGDILMKVFVVK
jgi:uncharacterized oligopeptide transporter (OPT) family protein